MSGEYKSPRFIEVQQFFTYLNCVVWDVFILSRQSCKNENSQFCRRRVAVPMSAAGWQQRTASSQLISCFLASLRPDDQSATGRYPSTALLVPLSIFFLLIYFVYVRLLSLTVCQYRGRWKKAGQRFSKSHFRKKNLQLAND